VQDYDTTNNTYTVSTQGGDISSCEDMVGVAGSFLGLRFQQRIPVGTPVMLAMGTPAWITNTGTIEYGDPKVSHSKTMLGTALPGIVQETAGVDPSTPKGHFPSDLLEGEFNWERVNGPFIRFLIGMVSIGANDRAKIETLLHRELVRITSHNYEHFAATGDIKNFDDGGLNQEEHGTTYEHERMGLREGEAVLEDLENPPDFDVWVNRTMRARWSKYTGFIGDLVNHWMTDPQAAIGEMATGQFRSGKSRFHAGSDGTLLWQACGDIILEHTHRIPVPVRLKHEEDPEGVVRDRMQELDERFLKPWKWSVSTPWETVFMLRDYARHMSQFQSMARFLQLAEEGEFEVPSEADTPKPMTVDPDREPVAFYDAYATIRIMRDGSIMSMDTYGNSTSSGDYGMKYFSSSDFEIIAARDVNIKAGRSVHISGKRNVELAAHRGGLILKSRTAFRALCERGTLWFKSDYDPEASYTPEDGDPDPEIHGDAGIMIQGLKSEIVIDSLTTRLQAKETVVVAPKEKLVIQAPQLQVRATTSVELHTPKLLFSIRRVIGKALSLLWIKGQLKVAGGSWEISNLSVNSIKAKSVRTLSGNVSKTDPFDILETPEDTVLPPDPNYAEVPALPDPEKEHKPARKWDMFAKEEYAPATALYEPVSHQRIRLGEQLSPTGAESPEYGQWPGMADALLPGEQTATGTGWPGVGAQWLQYTPQGDELGVPSSSSGLDFAPPASSPSLTKTSIVLQYRA